MRVMFDQHSKPCPAIDPLAVDPGILIRPVAFQGLNNRPGNPYPFLFPGGTCLTCQLPLVCDDVVELACWEAHGDGHLLTTPWGEVQFVPRGFVHRRCGPPAELRNEADGARRPGVRRVKVIPGVRLMLCHHSMREPAACAGCGNDIADDVLAVSAEWTIGDVDGWPVLETDLIGLPQALDGCVLLHTGCYRSWRERHGVTTWWLANPARPGGDPGPLDLWRADTASHLVEWVNGQKKDRTRRSLTPRVTTAGRRAIHGFALCVLWPTSAVGGAGASFKTRWLLP